MDLGKKKKKKNVEKVIFLFYKYCNNIDYEQKQNTVIFIKFLGNKKINLEFTLYF